MAAKGEYERLFVELEDSEDNQTTTLIELLASNSSVNELGKTYALIEGAVKATGAASPAAKSSGKL